MELFGGGPDMTVGVNQIKLGWIGNATADTYRADYPNNHRVIHKLANNVQFPLLDTLKQNAGTGGDTAFRFSSVSTQGAQQPMGQVRTVIADDSPNAEVLDFFQENPQDPAVDHVTALSGGYKFSDFIAAYSDSFRTTYVAAGKVDWEINFDYTWAAGAWQKGAGTKVTIPANGKVDTTAGLQKLVPPLGVTTGPSFTDKTKAGLFDFI